MLQQLLTPTNSRSDDSPPSLLKVRSLLHIKLSAEQVDRVKQFFYLFGYDLPKA